MRSQYLFCSGKGIIYDGYKGCRSRLWRIEPERAERQNARVRSVCRSTAKNRGALHDTVLVYADVQDSSTYIRTGVMGWLVGGGRREMRGGRCNAAGALPLHSFAHCSTLTLRTFIGIYRGAEEQGWKQGQGQETGGRQQQRRQQRRNK